MKDYIRWAWRRSWWLTLPIAIVFVLWARGTYGRWNAFHVRQETSDDLDLLHCAELQFDHMLRKATVGATHPRKGAALADTGLETIHLYVPESGIRSLDAHLPESGRHYVKGAMEYDGAMHDVDLRYRGDNVYHWGYWKKSWRVKTKREGLYDGMRKFNLVAPRTPEVLNNYLAYRLAAHMGLIAPRARLCNVMVNGSLMGLYVMTEQLDESTIRRHRRMPGDVYSGELIGRDTYLGARVELFDHPGAWTKVAINNHFDDAADAPLRALLHHVQRVPAPGSQAALASLVDIDAFARFSAFEALACTVHIDTVHNWRLYYDPWRTNFVPIVWDPVGWYWTMRPRPGVALRPDVITSPLHAALFQDGDFLRARWRVFAEFFEQGRDAAFLAEASATVRSLRLSLDLDPHLVAGAEIIHPERADAEARRLVADIAELFAELRATMGRDAPAEVAYTKTGDHGLRLTVSGRRPVDQLRVTFEAPVNAPVSDPIRAAIRWRTPRGELEADVGGTAEISGRALTLTTGLLASHRLSITSMEPEVSFQNGLFLDAATYALDLSLGPDTGTIVDLEWRTDGDPGWSRAGREEPGEPGESGESIEPVELGRVGPLHRCVPQAPRTSVTVWSGEHVIEQDVEVSGDLRIEAGTHVRLAPNASVFVRGRLRALGTPTAPIVFEPRDLGPSADDAAPWGTFALIGPECDRSTLEHCTFRLGSGSKSPLEEYSAMVSIHHVQDVRVEHCTFEHSRVVDDMVHGVYSDVTYADCTFRSSLFDALDMDISRVRIERCRFEWSGNDAVDLMTSEATVTDSWFTENSDKGISVGENSRLLAFHCSFDRCTIAVQSKDESTATLVNCDIAHCGIGLDAIKKIWRYDGGGSIYAYKSRIEECGVPLQADKHSVAALRDAFVTPGPAPRSTKRITVDGVDAGKRDAARFRILARFPAEERAIGTQDVMLWARAQPRRRGAALPAR